LCELIRDAQDARARIFFASRSGDAADRASRCPPQRRNVEANPLEAGVCVVPPRRDETIRRRHETIFAATRRNRETVNR